MEDNFKLNSLGWVFNTGFCSVQRLSINLNF